MNLYSVMADHYDEIFPLTPAKLDFVRRLVGAAPRDILDVGCATGSLALALASDGHRVTGIDLDERMISTARRRAGDAEATEFRVLDLRAVPSVFPPRSFDSVLCLGNTLPHLEGPSDILEAIRGFHAVLRAGAALSVQIVNFLRFALGELPVIEDDILRFTRRYERLAASPRLRFVTSLLLKADATAFSAETELYPLAHEELWNMLREAGFSQPVSVAGYDSRPFTPASPGLICTARRPHRL